MSRAYSNCKQFPIDWSLYQQNPYDFTNFMYVHSANHHHVEDMKVYNSSANLNPYPPAGDKYLGIVSKLCEPSNLKAADTGCDSIPYKIMVKDGANGTFLGGKGNPPYSCMNAKSENDYGECSPISSSKYHYYMVRDWKKVMDKHGGPEFCCVMPSQYEFKKNDVWVKDLQDRKKCLGGSNKTPIRTMKCPPTYHRASPICVDVMQKRCSNPKNWNKNDYENQQFCDLYTEPNNGVPQSNKNKVIISSLQGWLDTELKGGKKPPVPKKDPMIKTFANKCSENIGLCDVYLDRVCKNVTSKDLNNDPDLSRLCGCFMQDKEYAMPGIIPVECNGKCGINAVIGGVTRSQYNSKTNSVDPLLCKQSTCVIDDVSINLANSNLDGKISFNQLCGGCPSGTCTCVFSNIDINSVNSKIDGNINFEQSCGGCNQHKGKSSSRINCSGSSQPSFYSKQPPVVYTQSW